MAFQKSLFFILLLTLIIVTYLISSFSFKNGVPTCNNFLINVYLYLALSIVIVGLSCYGYNYILNDPEERNEYKDSIEIYRQFGIPIIIALIISFIIIIYISASNNFNVTNFGKIHFAWLLFLILSSSSIYPLFKSINTKDIVENALIITATIFTVMSFIAFLIPKFIEDTFNIVLLSALIIISTIIVFELFNIFFVKDSSTKIQNLRYSSYIIIFLFSILITYDTHYLTVLKKRCSSLPNYPKFSISFFLDIINIFRRTVFLASNE